MKTPSAAGNEGRTVTLEMTLPEMLHVLAGLKLLVEREGTLPWVDMSPLDVRDIANTLRLQAAAIDPWVVSDEGHGHLFCIPLGKRRPFQPIRPTQRPVPRHPHPMGA